VRYKLQIGEKQKTYVLRKSLNMICQYQCQSEFFNVDKIAMAISKYTV